MARWFKKGVSPFPHKKGCGCFRCNPGHQIFTLKHRINLSLSKKGKSRPDMIGNKFGRLRSGEKSNFWKGGITPLNTKIRNSSEFEQWARKIKERDNYTCQICGKRGVYLHSNHIKKFSDYPELWFELTNGVTICRDCDNKWVKMHEEEWENYFNNNLIKRGIIYG